MLSKGVKKMIVVACHSAPPPIAMSRATPILMTIREMNIRTTIAAIGQSILALYGVVLDRQVLKD